VQARISNPHWIAQARTIAYWGTTLIIAVELAAGGVWDILQVPYVHDLVVQHLGYPAYFLVIIGVWKVPGAVALLVPRFPLCGGDRLSSPQSKPSRGFCVRRLAASPAPMCHSA